MSKIQTEIGTVYSVNGSSVSISMSDSVKSNSPIIDGIVYRIGQIGSFLKIPLGYTSLYGIVTQIGADAIPEKISDAIKRDFNLLGNQQWLDDFERQTYTANNDPTTLALKTAGDAETLVSNQYVPAGVGNTAPFLNKSAKYILPFLDSIRTKLQDRRFDFLFQPGEYTPDLFGKIVKDISELLFSWIGGEKPITILDISDVPSDIMMSVAGTLMNITYEALFWGQEVEIGGRKQPLLIVLEEAHNYLRSGENSIASRNVQRIAKEGRKYGVGLMLVTQRPSELDETVLSQCGTIIALRMNNSKDRGYVSAAIQDELRSIVDLLPSAYAQAKQSSLVKVLVFRQEYSSTNSQMHLRVQTPW